MADNVQANAVTSSGPIFVSASLTWSGDTSNLPGTFAGILSGSEGAWTYTLHVGGAGAVTAGTQRMTLASDDPAVTALQLLDNSVYVDDADWTDNASSHVLVGGVYQSSPHTVTDGDVTPFLTDANGRLAVTIGGAITLPTGASTLAEQQTQTTHLSNCATSLGFIAATGIPITGSVAVTQSGIWDEVGINDSGNSITVDNNGTFAVQAVCTNAGTFVVQVDGTALTRLTDIETNTDSLAVVGNGAAATAQRVTLANDSTGILATLTTLTGSGIAHDGIDSGNPHKMGMKAIAHGTNPTAVAAADRSDLYCNRAGVPFVIGGHPNVISRTTRIADADGAQTDLAISPSVGAGAKAVVTRITIIADGDNTGDIRCKVGFGTATLPADSATGASGILVDHPGIPAGGGVTIGDGSGILGTGADDEEVRMTCEDPAGGFLTVTIGFYTIES